MVEAEESEDAVEATRVDIAGGRSVERIRPVEMSLASSLESRLITAGASIFCKNFMCSACG